MGPKELNTLYLSVCTLLHCVEASQVHVSHFPIEAYLVHLLHFTVFKLLEYMFSHFIVLKLFEYMNLT